MFHLIYFARTSTPNFYRNLQKIFCTCPSIGQYHTAMKIQPVRFVLPQLFSKKAMSLSPCFDIEYWRSYGPFLPKQSQWSKNQNIYWTFLIFNRIIFRFHGLQPHHSPFIPIIRILISINKLLSTLLLISTMVIFTSSLTFFFKYLGSNVVSNVYSWIYQFFSFFSCVWWNK